MVTLLAGWTAHQLAAGPPAVRWGEVGLATTASGIAATWFLGFREGERREAKALLRLLRA
jgi:hypothetical protein